MKLEDAIFNWLQITVVHEARPEDKSARDTSEFFKQMITEDHEITNLHYDRDAFMYTVQYEKNGQQESKQYALALVDKLLEEIENEPKYNEQ